MQEMQDLFMKKSFQAQVADYQNFCRSWSGSVVVLVGGSSAGKSTIVNALKNFDKGMLEEGYRYFQPLPHEFYLVLFL